MIHGHGRTEGKEAFDGEIENDAFEGSPKLTVERLIEEGDIVVAPHLGEGRLRGGDAFKFAGVTVFGFDGELISRVESYVVPLGLGADEPAASRSAEPGAVRRYRHGSTASSSSSTGSPSGSRSMSTRA